MYHLPMQESTSSNPLEEMLQRHRQASPSPSPSATESLQVMVNFTQFCPPATARGLFWNWTKAVSIERYTILHNFPTNMAEVASRYVLPPHG